MKSERIVKTFFNTWIDLEVVIGITDVEFHTGYSQLDYIDFTIICSTPPAHGTLSECNIKHTVTIKPWEYDYKKGIGKSYCMVDGTMKEISEYDKSNYSQIGVVNRLQLKVDELVKQWKEYKENKS